MNITDYKGKRIRTEFKAAANSQLAIFYPGYGYTLQAPAFFYLRELFIQKGFDILGIDYRYSENAGFLKAADEEKDVWFEYDCRSIGKEVHRFSGAYPRIVYVGKSLGTTMLMNQLINNLIRENAEIVYMTPGVYALEICSTIQRTKNRSLIVYGNADKYFNQGAIDLIKGRESIYLKEIHNAGHVFEEEGNIKQSILNLAEVIDSVSSFIE